MSLFRMILSKMHNTLASSNKLSSSFRDPSGFVFNHEGTLYRQINHIYADHYNVLMDSGFYQDLTQKGWLVPHSEVSLDLAQTDNVYRVIQPQIVPFISYPYEWCFSQYKAAALLTLMIQRQALKHDMILKDASVYNIQFIDGKPIFIDTLSFEKYEEGQPWIAYRQFCQHFVAPLALMSYKDIRFSRLLASYIDGIPLDLAASLLPKRSWLKLGLAMHIHLHSRAQSRHADDVPDNQKARRKLKRASLLNIVDNLEDLIKSFKWRADKTAWANYYEGDSYDEAGLDHKKQIVERFVTQAAPQVVWDLGANTGVHSRICSAKGIETIAWDVDAGAVELNYLEVRRNKERHLLPLLLDLTNPSPAIGWANSERLSLVERCNADLAMGLALIHHLAIGNNVPLEYIAEYFSRLAEWLIIEFVPKDDPKVKKLLATREDIFTDYTVDGFEQAFATCYETIEVEQIANSYRRLYLLRRK